MRNATKYSARQLRVARTAEVGQHWKGRLFPPRRRHRAPFTAKLLPPGCCPHGCHDPAPPSIPGSPPAPPGLCTHPRRSGQRACPSAPKMPHGAAYGPCWFSSLVRARFNLGEPGVGCPRAMLQQTYNGWSGDPALEVWGNVLTLQLRYFFSIERGNSSLQKVMGIPVISTDVYLATARAAWWPK